MSDNQKDPFEDWREWQDHRYDPGYFLGGRIHPLYKGKHSTPFGCAFLLMGTFALAFGFATLRHPSSAWQAVVPLLVGLLMVLAGSRMMAGKKSRH